MNFHLLCHYNVYEKASHALTRNTVAMTETIQAVNELAGEMDAFRNRYHPIVWWLFEIGLLK
jgi:hypothetical protein